MNLYPQTDLNNRNLGWIIDELKNLQEEIANGGIQVVSLAAQMTNHAVIYVYIGNEVGMNNDHWYYWDNLSQAWVDGGAWGGAAVTLPLAITDGGTGSTTASAARTALGITPANIGAVSTGATINISHGGTGATTKAAARTNLEITPANIGAEPAISVLPISKGGTNASTAAAARSNLGITPANIGAEPAISVLPIDKGGTGESTLDNVKTSLGIANVRSMDYSPISSGANKDFSVTDGLRGFIITTGSSSGLKELVIFNVTSSGSVSTAQVLNASSLTITTSTNTINIANGASTTCFVFMITF